MRCVSFCTAKNYGLGELFNHFKTQKIVTKTYRNVLHAAFPDKKADIFFFSHGCFVSWNLSRIQEQALLEQIKPFSFEPLDKIEVDYFSFFMTKKHRLKLTNDLMPISSN